MAISGSADFTLNGQQMVEASYRLLGVGSEGESLTSKESTDGTMALNLLLKSIHNLGVNLWSVKTQSITPVESKYSYTLGRSAADVTMDRPLEILEMYYRNTAGVTDTEVIKLSRAEYWNLSDKDTEGTVVNYYYDPQLTNGKLNVWPAPDATFAADYTLEVIYRKPIDDIDATTDNLEVPQEWLEPIRYLLAVRLAPEVGLGMRETITLEGRAERMKQEALDYDIEHTSIFFQPASH